jgi:hypothetical protein
MTVRATPWTVSYSDGSGNGFVFRGAAAGATFDYLPVDPARSSSGTYSGGAPRSGDIEPDGVEGLWSLVEKCGAASAEHTPDRSKGTGAFDIETSTGTRTFILTLGSPCRKEFEAFAKAYRGAPAGAALPERHSYEGVARNAKSGAVLVTQDGEIWVDLHEWPDELYGQKLRVTGRYEARSDLPVFIAIEGEPAVAGIPVPEGTDLGAAATRKVLIDLKWEVIP